jgi:hypothetical protein
MPIILSHTLTGRKTSFCIFDLLAGRGKIKGRAKISFRLNLLNFKTGENVLVLKKKDQIQDGWEGLQNGKKE